LPLSMDRSQGAVSPDSTNLVVWARLTHIFSVKKEREMRHKPAWLL
jgi:hypothetical protein